MLDVTLAELLDHQGTDLGHSGWVAVDQPRIDAFADATEDRQWIHVDEARAADGPFGSTIAHGYLTLLLVSVFLFDLLAVRDATSIVNYGLDKVRFPAPVPSGSRVRGLGTLVDVQDLGASVQTTTRVTIEREGGRRPVCVADVLTRFYA